MRCYLTLKAAAWLVYIAMIIPLLTSSCTLKLPYNNTKKLKYSLLDRTAQKIIKLNISSIENLTNFERVLLVKSCSCKKSNEEFNNYFKLFEHKCKIRNNSKSVKLRPVKLESSSKWRVMVSEDLMFLESCCICGFTNTVTLHLWLPKTISHYDFW